MEKWKEVYGFDILYEVSNTGKVRTKYHKRQGYQEDYCYLCPTDNGNGYLRLGLKKGNKTKTVYLHRLVAEAFIVNSNGYSEVNHIDENKRNNNADNLDWVSHRENCQHGTRNERTALKKRKSVLCVEKGIKYNSVKEAAKDFGTSITAISNCLNGRSKTCGGYHWEYEIL